MLLYVALVRVPFGTVVLDGKHFSVECCLVWACAAGPHDGRNVSCLAFGLWHVLAARHVTSFNPVFADLPGGQLGRVYGVVVAVSGTAVAGLVLCWLRLRSRSLLALALVHATVNGLGYGFACLAWRAP